MHLNNFDLKNGGLNGGLNEKQQKLLQLIKDQEGIKIKEIAFQLDIPVDTIDKQVKVLVSRGLVERRGSKRTGGYYVNYTNS